jgi:hypothetical protein
MSHCVVTFLNSETNQIESCLPSVPVLEGDASGNNIGNFCLITESQTTFLCPVVWLLSANNAPVMIGQNML